jgi:hypothetical protein
VKDSAASRVLSGLPWPSRSIRNDDAYLERFVEASAQVTEQAVRDAIEALAVVEGFEQANVKLREIFHTDRVGIDMGELVGVQTRLARLRTYGRLVELSGLPAELTREVMNRAVAREFPLKEGGGSRMPDPVKQALMQEFRSLEEGKTNAARAIGSVPHSRSRP